MNPHQISYVAVWSRDIESNRAVFASVLGIPIAYEDENVVVFQTEGAQLVLQRATGADTDLDGTVQFGFNVQDLDGVTDAIRMGNLHVKVDREELGPDQRVTVMVLPTGQNVEFVGE